MSTSNKLTFEMPIVYVTRLERLNIPIWHPHYVKKMFNFY